MSENNISSVDTKGAKQVWKWELRCTGCGSRTEVPTDVDRSIKGPVMDCDSCGSPMMLKRGSDYSSEFIASSAATFFSTSSTSMPVGSIPTALARAANAWLGVLPSASRSALVSSSFIAFVDCSNPFGTHPLDRPSALAILGNRSAPNKTKKMTSSTMISRVLILQTFLFLIFGQ